MTTCVSMEWSRHTTVTSAGVLALHGMCCSGLTLEVGSHVRLHGMVNGDVVNKGGDLAVYGMVNGDVVNRGGDLAVHGMVIGDVITTAGTTSIDSDAVIRGEVRDNT